MYICISYISISIYIYTYLCICICIYVRSILPQTIMNVALICLACVHARGLHLLNKGWTIASNTSGASVQNVGDRTVGSVAAMFASRAYIHNIYHHIFHDGAGSVELYAPLTTIIHQTPSLSWSLLQLRREGALDHLLHRLIMKRAPQDHLLRPLIMNPICDPPSVDPISKTLHSGSYDTCNNGVVKLDYGNWPYTTMLKAVEMISPTIRAAMLQMSENHSAITLCMHHDDTPDALVNQGNVVETCLAQLFPKKDDPLYNPQRLRWMKDKIIEVSTAIDVIYQVCRQSHRTHKNAIVEKHTLDVNNIAICRHSTEGFAAVIVALARTACA